jgi:transposase
MRVLLITREEAILARTKALTHLKSLLVCAPSPLHDQLRRHPTNELVARCSRLRTSLTQTAEYRATITALRATAHRALMLEAEAANLESQLELLLAEIAPELLDEPGIGPISAAQLLIAYSHTGRLRSEAAFASLAGAAPIPASSGQTVRYRLNRSGDRQLNRALHTIILSRLNHHNATRAYAHRRAAEGKTTREIKRCLKRYLARQLYRQLQTNPRLNPIPANSGT